MPLVFGTVELPTTEELREVGREMVRAGLLSEEGLAEALRELEGIEDEPEDDDEEGPDQMLKQWTKGAGYFKPVGDTQDTIPPGMYDIAIGQETGLVFIPTRVRTDDIIRFPEAPIDEVVDEIDRFWSREEVFREYGLPFKRGILLWGPPGSGKSTTLSLVSRDVIDRGGVVIIFDPTNFLAAYRAFRDVQPDTPIVALMEDLDAMLDRRESSTLNMLDGAESLHKVVFLATTNYPEKLDPRVKNRPSRFDRVIYIGHPGPESRRLYLEHLISGSAEVDIDQYVKDTEGMSLAHLKELFVATVLIGRDYREVAKDLRAMVDDDPHSASAPGTWRPGRYA